MNAYLTLIEKLANQAAALDAKNTALEIELNKIVTGDTIKERVEARKAAKNDLDAIAAKMAKVEAEKNAVVLAKKIAVEMYAKEAANRFIEACKAGQKGLIDTPTHYKKFKAAAAEALNEKDAIITSHYYTFNVHFQYYSVIGCYDLSALYTNTQGIITAADAEKAKVFDLIPAADIERIAANAIQDQKKVNRIKEDAKKEIEVIKGKYNTLYAITID